MRGPVHVASDLFRALVRLRRRYRQLDWVGRLSVWASIAGLVGLAALPAQLFGRDEPVRPHSPEPLRVGASQVSDVGERQTVLGCLTGEAYAMRGAAGSTLSSDDLDRSAYQLAPGMVRLSLEPDLPADEFVEVSSIDMIIRRHDEWPSSAALVVPTTACADGQTTDGILNARAVLDPTEPVLRLLSGTGAASIGGLVLRAGDPVYVRVTWGARRAGWYTVEVRAGYRYRGRQATARSADLRLYWPAEGSVPAAIYAGECYVPGYACDRVAPDSARAFLDEVPELSPPPLTGPEQRSGLISGDHFGH